MKKLFLLILFFSGSHLANLDGNKLSAQSVEIMLGDKYAFTDVQFLKYFDKQYRWSFFNRTRMQLEYDQVPPDIFSAGYLNYTTKLGLGLSLTGRVNNRSADLDVGLHFLKRVNAITFFGIVSLSLTEGGTYSWFSILRYRPSLNEQWKLYTSFELFVAMNKRDHQASIQRLRLGLDYKSFQFGLSANLLEVGNDFNFLNNNFGAFVRKEF